MSRKIIPNQEMLNDYPFGFPLELGKNIRLNLSIMCTPLKSIKLRVE